MDNYAGVAELEYAGMAKLADAHALGACEETRGGSNPPTRTIKNSLDKTREFLF
jgi:hypothetical protein